MNFPVHRAFIPALVAVVVIVAVLGMPLVLGAPIHHENGCPFMPGQSFACATGIFEHITHWQSAFATIFAELFALATLALFVLRKQRIFFFSDQRLGRIQIHTHNPPRPTLFQELFSQGILNRKEPSLFFV